MLPVEMTFADVALARMCLVAMYPNAQHVRLVENGYNNIVGLVDASYAVRFPRNANAFRRSLYVRKVLSSLKGIRSVEIPRSIGAADNPLCLTTTVVAGEHISSQVIGR